MKYTHLYSFGELTDTIIDEMDVKLYRIDSNEFTIEKLMELTYLDSTGRGQKFKDYQFFLEQSQKRKWIYMDKIFD